MEEVTESCTDFYSEHFARYFHSYIFTHLLI